MKIDFIGSFLSLSFVFALFGIYFIHFMPLPAGEYPWWDIYARPMLTGLCIGILGHAIWRFLDDINSIRIALEVRDRR